MLDLAGTYLLVVAHRTRNPIAARMGHASTVLAFPMLALTVTYSQFIGRAYLQGYRLCLLFNRSPA